MPAWLKEVGPTAAVAIAAFLAYLKLYRMQIDQNRNWGESRDKEREEFLKRQDASARRQEEQAKMFTGAIVSLVSLAHTMVGHCQKSQSPAEQVTPEHILKAADQAKNIGQN